jgi:hypothetical protein
MGWTNSVLIFYNNVTFILKAEIPHVTIPYINDVPIKELTMMYQKVNNSYETIPEDPACIGLFGSTLRTSIGWFRG